MAGTLTGLRLTQAILKGTINSAQLENLLVTDPGTYLSPWKTLINNKTFSTIVDKPAALDVVVGSDTAFLSILDNTSSAQYFAHSLKTTEVICANSSSCFTVISDINYLNYWKNVPANYTNLKNQVNAVGSKLKRVIITTPGVSVFNVPSGGVLCMALLVAGGGGNGASSAPDSRGCQGGSGAELKTQSYTTGLPLGGSSVNITVGTAGISSDVAGYLSALGGLSGLTDNNSGSPRLGPGTNSGVFFDPSWETAVYQYDMGFQGGSGGGGYAGYPMGGPYSNGNGTPGQAGAGAGSVGGTGGGGSGGGGGGQGLCSGGGGGGRDPSNGAGGGFGGGLYGNGGGGGGQGTFGQGPGGGGGQGVVSIYYVEA